MRTAAAVAVQGGLHQAPPQEQAPPPAGPGTPLGAAPPPGADPPRPGHPSPLWTESQMPVKI